MVFKRNITIKIACVCTELLISCIPIIFFIYLFFAIDKINEVWSTLMMIPYLILIINIVLIIISSIANIFIKTKYCVKIEKLLIITKTETREINYDEIMYITYDCGNLTKYNRYPSQLVLFDKKYKQLLSIINPSIIMVHVIVKKCKHAKISYYNNRRFLFLLLFTNGVALIVFILIKVFS